MKVDHLDIVQRVFAAAPAEKTVEGALAFTLRVLAALPRDEGAGLLLKGFGENIAEFHSATVSAGRLCYPDGQLYKVLVNIPAGNTPQWFDDGFVGADRYLPVPAADLEPAPDLPPPPSPPDEPAPWVKLLDGVDHLIAALEETVSSIAELDRRLAELQKTGVRVHL